MAGERPNEPAQVAHLGALEDAVQRRLAALEQARVCQRIWQRDPTVWKDDPSTPEIRDRLGWLTIAGTMLERAAELRAFAEEVRPGISRVVLCGMGGSSLAPEVLWRSFGKRDGFPSLHVLDTTDPRAIAAVERVGGLDATLFVISSKSGTTLETDCLLRHFWDKTGRGEQFVAVTDPGTPLARLAQERHFRRTFLAPPDIGGRYSALTYFGLVPAALAGIDTTRLCERGRDMQDDCAPGVPAHENLGAWLGALLGEAALAGRDKLTFVLSPGIAAFGLWVEQLIAESTGKEGKGILPVADEPLGSPAEYGNDRLFVSLELAGEAHRDVQRRLESLVEAGHPLLRLRLEDRDDLGGEFYRWEFATAVAGALLRINAFDQPNVAESKHNTLAVLEKRAPLSPAASRPDVEAFLRGVRAHDYVALLAYMPVAAETDRRLAMLRVRLRERTRAATTAGYGPRYLHSTGQLHKGGPATGHFLVITLRAAADVPIPGETYGFAQLQAAQAEGDLQALRARGRPALRLENLDLLETILVSG